MVADTQLNFARKKLFEALGDDFKVYLNSMKLWFRQKTTKESFDADARKLLASDTIHLHNEFLLAMLNKCQSLVSTHVKDSSGNAQVQNKDKQKKGKLKKKIRPVRATFELASSFSQHHLQLHPAQYPTQLQTFGHEPWTPLEVCSLENKRIIDCHLVGLLQQLVVCSLPSWLAEADAGIDEN
ncbi:transcriptional adapter 1-like [Limulus polyphemus]|uniref:Transcriptional adapter 1-like n=1 Tax=Limulus polyphemus TaxID=6850 RepID=A0ABM1B036_LIMPO|nr:transcriptional adapter 1-like [Limulus polyphemus]